MIQINDIVYISGPMTGRPAFNIPLFLRVETRLRFKFGCQVINPARQPAGLTWHEYMTNDIEMMRSGRATIVLQLPGWEKSAGALIEKDFGLMLGARIVCALQAGVVR